MRSFFITFEGADGCGKSTQSALLVRALRKKGFDVIHTREPGGTSFAENLRRILLNPKYKILPLAELLLYEASRAQHTAEVIRPALKKRKIVVCERYMDATTAYQGYGRGLNLSAIQELNKIATGNLLPDCTIVLDMPVGQAMKRAENKIKDRLEQEKNSFHRRVRKGYFALAKKEPGRVKIISATGSIQEVHERIWKLVAKQLGHSLLRHKIQ